MKDQDNRSKRKKKRSSVRNYLGNLQQNYCTVGEEKDIKEKERKDETKTGINGKIPWNKET